MKKCADDNRSESSLVPIQKLAFYLCENLNGDAHIHLFQLYNDDDLMWLKNVKNLSGDEAHIHLFQIYNNDDLMWLSRIWAERQKSDTMFLKKFALWDHKITNKIFKIKIK